MKSEKTQEFAARIAGSSRTELTVVVYDVILEDIKEAVKKQNQNTELLDLQLLVNDKKAHTEVALNQNAIINENTPRLYGSGMLVINAPWKLKESAEPVIDYLQSIFYR